MTIRASEQVKATVVGSIDDVHADVELAARLESIRLPNALLAEVATSTFAAEWQRSVGEFQDLLDAVSTAVGATIQALIDDDEALARTAIGGGPR